MTDVRSLNAKAVTAGLGKAIRRYARERATAEAHAHPIPGAYRLRRNKTANWSCYFYMRGRRFEYSTGTPDEAFALRVASRRYHQTRVSYLGGGPGVYLALAGDKMKIGRAVCMVERVTELQVGCPHDLDFAAVISDAPEHEHMVHAALAAFRVRGEWFEFSAASMDALTELSLRVWDA